MPELSPSQQIDVESNELTLRAMSGPHCVPSDTSTEELAFANIVLVSGQIVGGGKSTIINALVAEGAVNIPSATNRDLRPGEIEGIDKCHMSLATMAKRAMAGYFLELEEVRPGCFYATPAEFTAGTRNVKDVEMKGAIRLRSFAPEIPIIIPLPPVYDVLPQRVTEWERRVANRERYMSSVTDKAYIDLKGRLEGVVEETTRLDAMNIVDDPNTLIVLNTTRPEMLDTVARFLQTGEKRPQDDMNLHIERLRDIACTALLAMSE